MPTSSAWSKVAAALSATALFVALGGPAEARHLITGKDIKDGSIGAVDLSKAARKSLTGARGKRGPAGLTGPTGATGSTGAPGDPSTAGRVGLYRSSSTVGVSGDSYVPVASKYVVVPDDAHFVIASGGVSVTSATSGTTVDAYVIDGINCYSPDTSQIVTATVPKAGGYAFLGPQFVFPATPGGHYYQLCVLDTSSADATAYEPHLVVTTASTNATGGTDAP